MLSTYLIVITQVNKANLTQFQFSMSSGTQSLLLTNRVDIFYQVPNPSIWMYYFPEPATNRAPFVYT